MTTYPMHYIDNANSWRRIMMLARLYWPGLKPGFIVCAIVPLLAIFICAAIWQLTDNLSEQLFQFPIAMLIIFSPIMLTKRDYRYISSQLPVTAAEKMGFLTLTFWIVVPAIVNLSKYAGEWISIAVFGNQIAELINANGMKGMIFLKDYGFHDMSVIGPVISITSTIAFVTVVLYYVVTTKKNRVLAAFLSMIVIYVAWGLLVGIIGAIIGFIVGYQGMAEGASEEYMKTTISRSMIWIISIGWVLFTILGSVYGVKLYKRLRNCGF